MPLPQVGQPAPDFSLPGPDGQTLSLRDIRGSSNILLAFYPFDFSPICARELPGLQEQMNRFRVLDTVVLGVSTDSPYSHRAFAAELGLEFPLLSDFYGKLASQAYGVLRAEGFAERATFIIDKQGTLRHAVVHDLDQVPDVDELLSVLSTLEGAHA